MNFNIVKKSDKDEEEDILDEEEDIELDEDKPVKTNANTDAKKKMFSFMGIIILVTILLLFILYLFSLLSGKKYTYEDVEKVLKDAAVSYFADHPESLPLDEGSIVEVDSANLVLEEKMKDLSEYIDDDVACTGSVQVEKSGDGFLYTPYLNCGDKYITVEFAKKVFDDNEIMTSGYGLYAVGNGHAFRGENVNNYVKLDKGLWRIVKITGNDNVVLVSDEGVPYAGPWDNRYNQNRLYESGINNYNTSRIKEFLDKILTNPDEKQGENILSADDKTKTVLFNVCTGKRSASSEGKDNSEECLEAVRDQKIGLLTLSDFMYASVDPNCVNASSKTCKNYNYLSQLHDWWLVTANKDDDSTVFKVNNSGVLMTDNANTYSIIRPVIYLNSRIMYKSGKGTKESPYKIK